MAAKRIAVLLLFLLCCRARAGEDASLYPSRPVEIIVPFAAGGGMDVAARLIAKYAEPVLGQQISVVNRTRGGNIEGNSEGIAAVPDGYTLLAWGNGLVTDQLIVKSASYTHNDVMPVCMFGSAPEVIVVEAEFARDNGIATLEDLFEHARANPGQITIGMGGNWTTHDFLRLKMEVQADVSFNRMPFLGGAPALKATAEGNCNVAVPFISELMPYADSDAIVPLAVAFERRVSQFPEVPTTAELGYPDMTQSIWRVFSVPLGTSPAIVRRLESAFWRVLVNPEFRGEAEAIGVIPQFMNAEETRDFIEREYQFYAERTQEWGIRVR